MRVKLENAPASDANDEDSLPLEEIQRLEAELLDELMHEEQARIEDERNRIYSTDYAIHDRIERARRDAEENSTFDLAGTGIKVLDIGVFSGIEKLVSLRLSSNRLRELPSEIQKLKRLLVLDVADNNLTEFPNVIATLKKLKVLKISGNEIGYLPDNLSPLKSLVELEASECKVRSLSASIGNLNNLIKLSLNGNMLSELPVEMESCIQLASLELENNAFEKFPDVLKLLNLDILNLSYNAIDRIPKSVAHLRTVSALYLQGNRLTSLPAEIGELENIQILDLANNELRRIPGALGKLPKLRRLDLSYNKLTILPRALGRLDDNVELNLKGNPLKEPLPSILEQGTKALLSYLRSLENSTPQYEAKLLLVGEGGVGKSSLVAALRGEDFVAGRPTTHGIELGRLLLPHPHLNDDGKIQIQLNTWDFGGQEVYRITHQFFFSKRALYILAWKPREGQEQNSIEDWCRRIRLRVGSDARIFIVATHADERRAELDFGFLKSKFPDVLVGSYTIDSESGHGIEELKDAIAEEAATLPQMGEMISNRWTAVRQEILQSGKAHITRLAFERICSTHGLDELAAGTLATLLHDLGHIIHYSEDQGLRDLVVLQPEWLTKAIGFVLEDEVSRARGGILEHKRLEDIWSKPTARGEHGYSVGLHPYFLRLMEKFDITYRLSDSSSLVAQLVPYERPGQLEWEGLKRDQTTRRLRLICRLSEEAPGIIAWLTVLNHRFSINRHWRRGVVLVHRQFASQAVLELRTNGHDLVLTVLSSAPEYFFHLLRDSIEDLIYRRWKGLSYQFLVPCGQRLENGEICSGYFTYDTLIRFRQREEPRIPCYTCAEWSDVSKLLTGFVKRESSLDELVEKMHDLQNSSLNALRGIEAQSAESAKLLRAALALLTSEISDTPRLFTFYPADRSKALRVISTRKHFILHLWCEEPGAEHPVEGAEYDFRPTKEWVQTVGPYMRFVAKLLHFAVPIGIGAYSTFQTAKDLSEIQTELDLTKTLADKFPEPALGADTSSVPLGQSAGLSKAQGSGLRALRHLLLKLDPASTFGGLRRVRSSSADLLWVCEAHYPRYDPGLPNLGYVHSTESQWQG